MWSLVLHLVEAGLRLQTGLASLPKMGPKHPFVDISWKLELFRARLGSWSMELSSRPCVAPAVQKDRSGRQGSAGVVSVLTFLSIPDFVQV